MRNALLICLFIVLAIPAGMLGKMAAESEQRDDGIPLPPSYSKGHVVTPFGVRGTYQPRTDGVVLDTPWLHVGPEVHVAADGSLVFTDMQRDDMLQLTRDTMLRAVVGTLHNGLLQAVTQVMISDIQLQETTIFVPCGSTHSEKFNTVTPAFGAPVGLRPCEYAE